MKDDDLIHTWYGSFVTRKEYNAAMLLFEPKVTPNLVPEPTVSMSATTKKQVQR